MAKTVISKDIIPLSEFRANASTLIGSFKEQPDKAIIVTQNGRPAAVVLSVAEYEDLRASIVELRQLAEGMIDLRKGTMELIPHEEVMQRMKQTRELGEKIERIMNAD